MSDCKRWRRVRGIYGVSLLFAVACAVPASPQAIKEDIAGQPGMAGVAPVAVPNPAELRLEFYRRHLLNPFMVHGEVDPAIKPMAEAWLDDICRYLAGWDYQGAYWPQGVPTLEAIGAGWKRLSTAGVDDLYLAYVAVVFDRARTTWTPENFNLGEVFNQWRREKGVSKDFDVAWLMLDRYIIAHLLKFGDVKKEWITSQRREMSNRYADLFTVDAPITPADDADLARLFNWLSDDLDSNLLEPLMAASQDVPAERRWLAHVIRGVVFVETAWAVRGGGWADTVGDAQWVKFGELLAQARQEYEAAWALRQDLAEPAAGMITVAMGQSTGDEMIWLDRAASAQPGDSLAYHNTLWAMRPRWGGDAMKMFAVAMRALDQGSFATEVPDQFDACLDVLADDYGLGVMRQRAPALWPMLDRYLEQRAKHPTARRSADWCYSRGVQLAHRWGNPEKVLHYFEKLDRDVMRLRPMHLEEIDQRWYFGELYARQDPAVTAACHQADALAERGDHAGVVALLEPLLPQARSPWIRLHLEDRLRVARGSITFARGEWTELLEHGVEGWRPMRGRFVTVPGKPGVKGQYDKTYGMRMLCGLDPGTRYEAELSVEVPEGFAGRVWGGIGLMFGADGSTSFSDSHMVFLGRQKNRTVWIADPGQSDQKYRYFGNLDLPRASVVRVQRWDDAIRVEVNGQLVVERFDFLGKEPLPTGLAIGAWHGGMPDALYRVPSLRVRPLTQSPFEAPATPDAPQMF